MTRFDAADPDARVALIADAIAAHRERDSAYCTLEAPTAPETPMPWIQYGDGVCNLDCTDGEFDRLKGLLDEFGAFAVDELDSPEDAEGTNVKVRARTDPDRVAQFVETVFREVYGLAGDYRLWATEI